MIAGSIYVIYIYILKLNMKQMWKLIGFNFIIGGYLKSDAQPCLQSYELLPCLIQLYYYY